MIVGLANLIFWFKQEQTAIKKPAIKLAFLNTSGSDSSNINPQNQTYRLYP